MAFPQPLPRVLTAEEVVPTMKDIIFRYNNIRDEIIRSTALSDATFETVIRPYVEVVNACSGQIHIIYMLQYGSPDIDSYQAFNEARELLSKAGAVWVNQEAFFKLVQEVHNKSEDLDLESGLLVREILLDYKRSGLGLLNQQYLEDFRREKTKIGDVQNQMLQNITKEDGGLWFAERERSGVPDEDLTRWENGIEQSDLGKKWVSFANGGVKAVLTFATSSETRKRMFLGDNMKLKENGPLFEDL